MSDERRGDGHRGGLEDERVRSQRLLEAPADPLPQITVEGEGRRRNYRKAHRLTEAGSINEILDTYGAMEEDAEDFIAQWCLKNIQRLAEVEDKEGSTILRDSALHALKEYLKKKEYPISLNEASHAWSRGIWKFWSEFFSPFEDENGEKTGNPLFEEFFELLGPAIAHRDAVGEDQWQRLEELVGVFEREIPPRMRLLHLHAPADSMWASAGFQNRLLEARHTEDPRVFMADAAAYQHILKEKQGFLKRFMGLVTRENTKDTHQREILLRALRVTEEFWNGEKCYDM